ncbi:hypothetical protein CC80DRAFT_569320 [Byssothecium circinans]|uniref:Peptidase S54 rhomboid domain-containing protein n=1 Tax=Byssothecium circinans TaxID=147558 RepID=A0A6A5TN73_9PLEO|nr:hypothetical protein CC80DRAFT_569320 [Byssothecium circinans]
MSNAIPMAFRPAARLSSQWNSVTLAFARRYCTQQTSCFSTTSPSPILSSLQSRSTPQLCRAFSTTQRYAAKVHNPPTEDPLPPSQPFTRQKRRVKIGPLPGGPVDEGTIRRIFGPKVSASEGNAVLRILHHRRTSGSLADYGVDNLGQQYSHVKRQVASKGLDWLREKHPVDEARAAEEWAEREANRIAYNLWLADPENDSKYKDPARAFREHQKKKKEEEEVMQEEQAQLGGQRIGILHHGPSQFERNIEEKRRQRLEEITKKAEEKEARAKDDEVKLATGEWVRTPSGTQLMKPGQETYVDIFGREQVSRRKEEMEKAQKKAQSPFKNEDEMLSKTTVVQRLYPMSAFVLIVCLLSYGVGHYYSPPSDRYRLWPSLSLTTATIAGLFLANFALLVAWRWTPLWPLMTRYFMHVPGYPRAFQAVGNVFSHVQYEHFLGNMMWLVLVIGPVSCDLFGRGIFLGTYISAGAVGSLATLYWANLGRGNISAHSVGASAALWGVTTLFCLMTDKESIKIPFLKDFEVMFWPKMLLAAFVGMEIFSAVRSRGKGTMDHASHFGGMLTGAVVAGYLHGTGWKEWRRRQDEGEREEKVVDVVGNVKGEVEEVKEQVRKVVK